jgi:hypothetical protein
VATTMAGVRRSRTRRIERLIGVFTGAVALAVASCSGDDAPVAAGGRSGTAARDAGHDSSAGGGGGAGTAGRGGTSGASGSGGIAGSAGAIGSAGAVGSAGSGADSGADDGSDADAPLDTATDVADASDSTSDGPSDGSSADACTDCWIGDRFPDGGPGTITVTGRIRKTDNVCAIVFGGGQCQAQNTPPCNAQSGQSTVMLDLTLDAAGKLTVEAPYQDMCAQDYFCAVSGPGCPIPTSYDVPTATTFSYPPRSTDRCRRDLNGAPYNVSHQVGVRISGRSLIIDQLCTTHMLNLSSQVVDVRNWTTTIDL